MKRKESLILLDINIAAVLVSAGIYPKVVIANKPDSFAFESNEDTLTTIKDYYFGYHQLLESRKARQKLGVYELPFDSEKELRKEYKKSN